MTARLVAGAALAAVFLLMLPDPKPLDVPIALAVAAAALLAVGPSPLAHPRNSTPGASSRVGAVPGLIAAIVADVATGTIRVAAAVTGARPPRAPGVVAVDLRPGSQQAIVLTGVLVTVSPSSVLVTADAERGVLHVHVIDGDDPDTVRAQVARLHERVARMVGG